MNDMKEKAKTAVKSWDAWYVVLMSAFGVGYYVIRML